MLVRIEAKAGDPVLRVARTDGVKDLDGNHIFRLGQTTAQRHRAVECSVVVFRLPGLAAGDTSIKEKRCIIDDRRWCEAFLQGCRIDERFKTGSGLAPGLCDVVELVFGKVKAANQRFDCTVPGIQCQKRAFDFGKLGRLPCSFVGLRHTDQRARANLDVGSRFLGQAGEHGLEALSNNFQCLTTLALCQYFFRPGFDDDSA